MAKRSYEGAFERALSRKVAEAERKLAEALPNVDSEALADLEALRSLCERMQAVADAKRETTASYEVSDLRAKAQVARIRAHVCSKPVVDIYTARAVMRPDDWSR